MDDLIQKYNSIINSVNENLWVEYANTLEFCVNYLKPNKYININLKIAATFIVQQLFLNDNNFKEKQINLIIDDFINYHDNEYLKYMNTLEIITDKFNADLCFYYSYINKQ